MKSSEHLYSLSEFWYWKEQCVLRLTGYVVIPCFTSANIKCIYLNKLYKTKQIYHFYSHMHLFYVYIIQRCTFRSTCTVRCHLLASLSNWQVLALRDPDPL